MWRFFLQGFFLGMALIVPIGPQNVMVINQGIRRQYFLLVATLCFISDLLLICAGVFGGAALVTRSPWLLLAITLAGVLSLGGYGFCALRNSWRGVLAQGDTRATAGGSRRRVLLTILAVTWLNPHVYPDTVVILGSVAGQLAPAVRGWFAGGTISASLVWFYGLALIAVRLAPWLIQPRVQRAIQWLVGIVMWCVALQLLHQGWRMFRALAAF